MEVVTTPALLALDPAQVLCSRTLRIEENAFRFSTRQWEEHLFD
jgi:hypothetical protein